MRDRIERRIAGSWRDRFNVEYTLPGSRVADHFLVWWAAL